MVAAYRRLRTAVEAAGATEDRWARSDWSKQVCLCFIRLIQTNALGPRSSLHLGSVHFVDRRQKLPYRRITITAAQGVSLHACRAQPITHTFKSFNRFASVL